jgi:UDPglucose--hexose-1-phosphate uridylyltransferase
MGCSNPHPHCQVWSTSAVPTIVAKEFESLSRYSLSDQSASSSDAPKGPGGKPSGCVRIARPRPYFHGIGRPCLLCDYAHLEASDPSASRVVVKNNDWIAVVPWWAIWPFEILCWFSISSRLSWADNWNSAPLSEACRVPTQP